MKDYYELLGIKNNVNENDIYDAYKNKISQFNHLSFHTSKMIYEIKNLKEALYVLGDNIRRKKYDNKCKINSSHNNGLDKYFENDKNSGYDNTQIFNRLFSVKF